MKNIRNKGAYTFKYVNISHKKTILDKIDSSNIDFFDFPETDDIGYIAPFYSTIFPILSYSCVSIILQVTNVPSSPSSSFSTYITPSISGTS